MTEPLHNEAGESGKRVWERGWRDHEQCQLERLANLSLSDKLASLEETHRLVLEMSRQADPHVIRQMETGSD